MLPNATQAVYSGTFQQFCEILWNLRLRTNLDSASTKHFRFIPSSIFIKTYLCTHRDVWSSNGPNYLILLLQDNDHSSNHLEDNTMDMVRPSIHYSMLRNLQPFHIHIYFLKYKKCSALCRLHTSWSKQNTNCKDIYFL